MSLTIGIDFDHTYAADPQVFSVVVELLLAAGHDVLLVTKRHDDGDGPMVTEVNETVTNDIPIIFVGGTDILYKDEHVRTYHDLEVDIWIDDKPEFIRAPSQIKDELDAMVHYKHMMDQEIAFFKGYVKHLEGVIKDEAQHLWDDIKAKFKRDKT